jgi:hypothetical protein
MRLEKISAEIVELKTVIVDMIEVTENNVEEKVKQMEIEY